MHMNRLPYQNHFQFFLILLCLASCGSGASAPDFTISANPLSLELNEDETVSSTLTASTNLSSPLSFSINPAPAHGSVNLEESGKFTYTPNKNYFGADSFLYTVSSSIYNKSSSAQVSITINPIQDLPTITFTLNKEAIYIGEEVIVSWEVIESSECLASGDWSGDKSANGSENISFESPGKKILYLKCEGIDGFTEVSLETLVSKPEPFLNKFPANQGIDIILVYGQSNASGNGRLNSEDALKLERENLMYRKCKDENANVLISTNCGQLEIIAEPSDIYEIGGYSAWTTFSTNLEIMNRRKTIFLNAAVGGTTLKDLLRSGSNPIKGTTNRFQNLIWGTRDIFKSYARENINSVSLIWLQGESNIIQMGSNNLSDKELKEEFAQYFLDLEELRTTLLSDIDIPYLYFYIIRMGVSGGAAREIMPYDLANDLGYWQIHFACTTENFIPLSILPRTYSSQNQKLTDGIHYSRLGYDTLGEESANSFDSFMQNIDVSNYICSDNQLFAPTRILESPFD
jgi:hypothetical protein